MNFYRIPAETTQRLSAALLDCIFFLVLLSPWGIVHGTVLEGLKGGSTTTYCALGGWGLACAAFGVCQIAGLIRKGQSWGMRITKIRVVRKDGRSAGFYRAVFLRCVVFGAIILLPVAGQVFLLGHWISLFIPHKTPWRDRLSGTTLEQAWD